MPRVLKLKNDNNFDQIVNQIDNSVLVPVNDGNGDLVLPVEILQDSRFSHLHSLIISLTDEIDYVPFPESELDFQQKVDQLSQNGKLIKHDFINKECEYKNKKVKFKKTTQSQISSEATGVMGKIGNAFKTAVQFVVDIFK